jgi:uncharacterized membrane protein
MKREIGHTLTLAVVLGAVVAVTACDRGSTTEPALPQTGIPASMERSPAEYAYTVIDVPNATWTQVYRMNARGDVVGSYSQSGLTHGFLLRRGTFQTLDVAGATHTQGRGINERGDIVGFSNTSGTLRGFLLSNGEFTTIEYPDAVGTRLWDINARGDIAGEYQATAGAQWRGFVLSQGEFTPLSVPSANMSAGFGINEDGAVVGHYTEPGTKMFGFLFSDGAYTQFDHPASGTKMTCAQGIGVHGEVVGHFGDAASSAVYGYLWTDGELVAQLQVPDAKQTYPLSITPGGVIAGYHVDASDGNHGFIATPLNPAGR